MVCTGGKLRLSRDLSLDLPLQPPFGSCIELSLSAHLAGAGFFTELLVEGPVLLHPPSPGPPWVPLSPFGSCDINKHKNNQTASHTIRWG